MKQSHDTLFGAATGAVTGIGAKIFLFTSLSPFTIQLIQGSILTIVTTTLGFFLTLLYKKMFKDKK